jgi:hypothetical protein
VILAAVVVGVGWFYLWTARPESPSPAFAKGSRDYYNLLTRGFLKGHLSLDAEADPFLATLKNPWDPVQRAGHGMHDASYYNGRYYIYFGASPVLLLFLPVTILTGMAIDQGLACVVFAWVGLCAAALLVEFIRRRYFPKSPAWVALVAVASLGLTDTMPMLLRRPNVWEVPITCAYACFMIGLCLLYGSLHSRRRWTCLAFASTAFGLAVGARPTYLLGCAALLVPLLFWMREAGGFRKALADRSWRAGLAAAVLPLAVIGAALAAYNFGRFGRVTEFGQAYQMYGGDGSRGGFFNWSFLVYGLRVYWLLPANWSPYFPFVTVANAPDAPAGQMGVEDPYGILPNMPYIFLGLGILAIAGRNSTGEYSRLLSFCRAVAIACVAIAVTVMSFGGITNRYMVDFTPGFILLASIGLLAITTSPSYTGWTKGLVNVSVAALFLYSSAFNVLASFRHNELLRAEHPDLYKRMVHGWNRVPYAFDRWFNHGYGDLKMSVVFPQDAAGTNEPLIVTGDSFRADYLIVHYEPHNLVRFGLIHTGSGAIFGEPITVEPGVPHTIVASLGSIYPPPGHPFFDIMKPDQALLKQEMVIVNLDGNVALQSRTIFNDATSWNPSIGRSDTHVAYLKPFSGKILSWTRLPLSQSINSADVLPSGPAQLTLRLPPFRGVQSEPLVCSGEPGRGDLLFIKYLNPKEVEVGFDHWGVGGSLSDPIEVDPSGNLTVTVDYGALHPQDDTSPEDKAGTPGRLLVIANGKTMVDSPQLYYRCSRALVAIGNNIIGASTSVSEFTGTIVRVTYLNK